MKFTELVHCTANAPVFETGILLSGDVDANHIRRQLSRWVQAGKVIQIRRGLYTLNAPFRQVEPHPFYIANQMVKGSYVSLQSALSYYGLIPEYVPVTTSVHSGRPNQWKCELGVFRFQHITRELYGSYRRIEVVEKQHVFIAEPEKALLDLVHLTPGSDSPLWVEELRLQDVDSIDVDRLSALASASGKRKQMRFAKTVASLAESEDYVAL